MTQEKVAAAMLSDPMLLDQGYLSRFLVAAPASRIGTRLHREPQPASSLALEVYNRSISELLEAPQQMLPGERNALDPRRLEFSPEARPRWIQFADQVEAELRPNGTLHPVKGFGAKLAEHAARIAGILTIIEDIVAPTISLATLERAIRVASFYAAEAVRLFEAGVVSHQLDQAEKLRRWLMDEWKEPLIGMSAIYLYGPNSIRTASAAKPLVEILVEHGCLIREPNGGMVKGKAVKEAWRIIREC